MLSPPCHSERSEESHAPSSRTWRGLGFRGERDPSLRSGCQRAQASHAAVGAFGPLGSRFLSGFPMKNVGNDRGVGLRFLPCCRFLPCYGFLSCCRPPVILSEAKNPTRPQAAPGAGWSFGGTRPFAPLRVTARSSVIRRGRGFRNSGFQVAESREQIRMA